MAIRDDLMGLGTPGAVAGVLAAPVFQTSGTFTCNGTTNVVVTTAATRAAMIVAISLNTVGGTVGAIPKVTTITAGTSFTVAGTASDTSVYNWAIIGFTS